MQASAHNNIMVRDDRPLRVRIQRKTCLGSDWWINYLISSLQEGWGCLSHTDSGAFSVYIVKRHWCDIRYYEDQNLRDGLARSLDFKLRQIATWFWQNLKITCVGFSVPVTATLWTIVFFPLHVVTKCPTWWTYFSTHLKKGQSGNCNGPLQIHIYDPIPTLDFHTLTGMVKNELQ
jgi:hypothetical protein